MKLNDTIMEEAAGLLEYEAPALRELDLGLAFGGRDSEGTGNSDRLGAVFGADGEDGEENETYSLDDY